MIFLPKPTLADLKAIGPAQMAARYLPSFSKACNRDWTCGDFCVVR